MPVVLAPMAGISDLPFRTIVRRFGVGMSVAEMISAKSDLQNSRKNQQRRISLDEPLPRAIQIVGNDPQQMAEAAAINENLGAGIIDINMGCPAKKVYKKAAGSALMADERNVQAIIKAVVAAVDVPVTLKIRTGISRNKNNAVNIARIAEAEGVQSLAVHGRSRACLFNGSAEYDTIAKVKQAVAIPVIANGDIASPKQAHRVLALTGADGVMLGRAVRGQPWLPMQVGAFLAESEQSKTSKPALPEQKQTCLDHVQMIHEHYGEKMGVRIARKHIRWYLQFFRGGLEMSAEINRIENAHEVLRRLDAFYDQHGENLSRAASIQSLAA